MPELPEVEDAARRLRQAAQGRTITSVVALHPSLARSLTPTACRSLRGRRIEEVNRRAKMQLVTLDDGQVLEVHFRMTGDWVFGHEGDPAPAHERVRIACSDGTRISLTDGRALAVLRLHAPGKLRLPELGPEPLEETFSVEVFAAALATRSAPIKPVLLDQKVVAGIGNIYAAEALWVARIHPTRAAASLSRPRVEALRDAIREVLHAATPERYHARDEVERDDARSEWRVYDREGKSCMRCARMIRRITQSGRSTYYCGGCQR
ncbi:MAG: bifunctional DNA-formamidopyrimidine glycosylase/DNA-(apurinic or apyrimidinic site) lyase [Gemmatimonadaceae bacterium]|nr:bifunctional DNA-formamidopyrimidine glycosylase/DNA-(apurinic or apyrimidinic site) lyase [Gemmatimonadaceae bacterium]